MRQIAFLIDALWLHDEEITAAIRYSCLQLLTAWSSDSYRFGYLLFDSERGRTQKVQPVDFAPPNTSLIEEFEAQLGQSGSSTDDGKTSVRKSDANSPLETIRWAVSRSVTDFSWHSVSVCSPVKASRKRRSSSTPASTQSLPSTSDDEHRNLLFIFARLPSGTLSRIRDELVTASLGKCLQESRIKLTWVHDSYEALPASAANSSKCGFLRMRDLIQLCGFFPPESLQHGSSIAPPSVVVRRLLQNCSGGTTRSDRPMATCTIGLSRPATQDEPFSVNLLPSHALSTTECSAAGKELIVDEVIDEPSIASVLQRSQALFIATSDDAHFHRLLAELRASKKVAILSCDRQTFVLKSVADSIGVLVSLTDRRLSKFEFSEVPAESVFHSVLLETWYRRGVESKKKPRIQRLVDKLASLYDSIPDTQEIAREFGELEVEPLPDTVPMEENASEIQTTSENYNSEVTLLQGLRQTYEKAIDGKLSPTTSAQSILSASMRFFESDFTKTISFIEEHFQPPLQSSLNKIQWANECRTYILISFEMACLAQSDVDTIRTRVVATMRKLLFLTSPRDLFDFIRDTLKGLYLETVRPLLEDLADEFDLPLFPESDEDGEISSIGSFAEPMSGISSLGAGSIINSVPRSAPIGTGVDSHNVTGLRRLNSATICQPQLSQRHIEIPRRRSVRIRNPAPSTSASTSSSSLSPQKRQSSRAMPTTPKGKRILKTQVVPETPVGKQAPNRVQRNQERLRRRSSMMNSSQGGSMIDGDDDDDVDEIDESPVKGSATSSAPVSPSPRKRGKIQLSPTKENLTRAGSSTTTKSVGCVDSPVPRPSPRKSPRVTPRKRLTRQLMFSPPKAKPFTSPSAISLLHLTTSPVIYRPAKKRTAPSE